MLLTVEKEKREQGEIAICFDLEGLDHLISQLVKLRRGLGHSHLMTPAWAGQDLTEEPQGGAEYELCHHLRLVHLAR